MAHRSRLPAPGSPAIGARPASRSAGRSQRPFVERRPRARAGGGARAQAESRGVALAYVLHEELGAEAIGLLRVLVVIALALLADLGEALESQLAARVAEGLEGV